MVRSGSFGLCGVSPGPSSIYRTCSTNAPAAGSWRARWRRCPSSASPAAGSMSAEPFVRPPDRPSASWLTCHRGMVRKPTGVRNFVCPRGTGLRRTRWSMVKHVPHIQKCLADRGLTGFDVVMSHEIRQPVKARSGDKVAVLSPSFAAPGFAPAVHGQAMLRLTEVTGLVPVEYPTTRLLDASQQARADDVNAAFADPEIRAVLATIGGDDQITIIPYLESALVRADPKPFLGYSDNTNLLNWLWNQGVAGFYGGSTQVQLGPGPAVDAVHIAGLRAALLTGERLELSEPGES